jgi:hypothetical protein
MYSLYTLLVKFKITISYNGRQYFMDISLRDYLSLADETQEFVDKFGVALKTSQLEEKVVSLQAGIKNIQTVAKHMADIANIVNQIILGRKNRSDSVKYINPYPSSNDHAVLRITDPIKTDEKYITDDIKLPIKTVNKPEEIPTGNIYYIKSLKQYAINILGTIIKGNLANLVEYQTKLSARCEYGIKCKSFDKNIKCNYYHDPEDFIKLNKKIPDDIRNYTVGSWLYSRNRRPKTYFTRHVGSRNTLSYDLNMLKHIQYREEISNREGQIIHDLLIYMVLHSKGMLERYPHWLNVD